MKHSSLFCNDISWHQFQQRQSEDGINNGGSIHELVYSLKSITLAVFTLAEFITIMPATATSETCHCSCLGHLGLCDTDRIVSISCRVTQGGQGKNIFFRCHRRFCQNNMANVNDPQTTTQIPQVCHLAFNQQTIFIIFIFEKIHYDMQDLINCFQLRTCVNNPSNITAHRNKTSCVIDWVVH